MTGKPKTGEAYSDVKYLYEGAGWLVRPFIFILSVFYLLPFCLDVAFLLFLFSLDYLENG